MFKRKTTLNIDRAGRACVIAPRGQRVIQRFNNRPAGQAE
jgi:hypothetical protein